MENSVGKFFGSLLFPRGLEMKLQEIANRFHFQHKTSFGWEKFEKNIFNFNYILTYIYDKVDDLFQHCNLQYFSFKSLFCLFCPKGISQPEICAHFAQSTEYKIF